MKINIIIPAKGSSKRIKNKNLHEVAGKNLVHHTCEKVLNCSPKSRLNCFKKSTIQKEVFKCIVAKKYLL